MSKSETPLNLYYCGLLAVTLAVFCPTFSGLQTALAEEGGQADWIELPTDDTKIWTPSVFGGDGDITFTADAIKMTAGDPITGVRCSAEIPKENFEIELEGRRTNNFDFFCALTFPVGEDGRCSFVVGGWAGAVVGLSSVDGLDAARNSTKKLMNFENGQWYKIRVRVDAEEIQCWIDDKLIVQQPRADHKFDIRVEMHESLPVGIAAFMCDSEIRNVRWRKLAAAGEK